MSRVYVWCTVIAGLLLGPSGCVRRREAASAPTPSALVGRVTDVETGAPLPRIQVFLGGTAISTLTDSSGRYALYDIPPGKYTVVAGHARLFTQTVSRAMRAGRVDTLNFRLRFNPGPIR